jgi:hypothetical protein
MRIGRNPRNGDKVVVPEKFALHFKTGKALREGVISQTEAQDLVGGSGAHREVARTAGQFD